MNGLTLSQLGEPFLLLYNDPGIWIFHKLGIPQFIIQQPFALLFDATLLIMAVVGLYLFWKGKKAIVFTFVFALLFSLYMITAHSYPNLSPRQYFGLFLIPYTFLFLGKRFKNYTELIRYFVLFVFFSAAMWKLTRGILTEPDQMFHVIQGQHIETLFLLPENGLHNTIARWLLNHKALTNAILFAAVGLQFSFIIGFFTKKFDKLLFLLMFMFLLNNFLIMGIEYWTYLVFTPYFFIPEIEKRYA